VRTEPATPRARTAPQHPPQRTTAITHPTRQTAAIPGVCRSRRSIRKGSCVRVLDRPTAESAGPAQSVIARAIRRLSFGMSGLPDISAP
jgi:hypothetical protein